MSRAERDVADLDARDIYRRHADRYDELVRAEDHAGRLMPAIAAIVPIAGATVVEVGCGTGRVTRLLLGAGARIVHASEREAAMLAVARTALAERVDGTRYDADRDSRAGLVTLHRADGAALPVRGGVADLAIAGWVFGHLRYWLPDDWREAIGRAVSELERTLRPGGTSVVIETLGTGSSDPAPPSEALAEYYAWLETDRGYTRDVVRTDYQFPSPEEAARVAGFFFGEAFAAHVLRERWATVPECTGVWWRRTNAAG